jgi:hypothetical protein
MCLAADKQGLYLSEHGLRRALKDVSSRENKTTKFEMLVRQRRQQSCYMNWLKLFGLFGL